MTREPRETAAPEQGDSAESVTDQSQPNDQQRAAESDPAPSSEMTDDLAKAREDLMVLTSDLQRLQAEYVNYKRRVDRDREVVRQNAVFAALATLLPVLDDIDRAREHGEVEGGFKVVADSLDRAIVGMGLVRFGKPGDEFDPNMHEALMHAHSPDVTTTTCQLIISAGYRIGDRVVRPARVTVVDPEPIPPDVAPEVAPEVAHEVAPEVAHEVAPEVAPEVAQPGVGDGDKEVARDVRDIDAEIDGDVVRDIDGDND